MKEFTALMLSLFVLFLATEASGKNDAGDLSKLTDEAALYDLWTDERIYFIAATPSFRHRWKGHI